MRIDLFERERLSRTWRFMQPFTFAGRPEELISDKP
jgi:hypothetical protein